MTTKTTRDSKDRVIQVGVTVHVDYIDRGRGAEMWMDKGTVIGFAQTRVLIDFPSRVGACAVGPECLTVVQPKHTHEDDYGNGYTVAGFLDALADGGSTNMTS